jgi:hypothetical protein
LFRKPATFVFCEICAKFFHDFTLREKKLRSSAFFACAHVRHMRIMGHQKGDTQMTTTHAPRLIDIRMAATSALPSDVMNDNCVQDALYRLREELRRADASGAYRETDQAPAHLVKAQSNLWAWINEARTDNARRADRAA